MFFSILDYAGSASQRFADPEIDGEPVEATQAEIDAAGAEVWSEPVPADDPPEEDGDKAKVRGGEPPTDPRKLYGHGGPGAIATETTEDLSADGKKLRTVTQYAAETVHTLYADAGRLRAKWQAFDRRTDVLWELGGCPATWTGCRCSPGFCSSSSVEPDACPAYGVTSSPRGCLRGRRGHGRQHLKLLR